MKIIPIAFAFDNNIVHAASICICSLLINGNKDTYYDIFIIHSEKENLAHAQLDQIPQYYPNCRIQYRTVDGFFDSSFEIRGITTPAYYRLLIPELIPEYDKVIYSDVDVIFRDDLSCFFELDLKDCYIAGVNSLAHFNKDTLDYYNNLGIDAKKIIYSGNLIFNSKKMREDQIVDKFKAQAHNKYKFQDMDIINIVCKDRIFYLQPSFCLTNYINQYAIYSRNDLEGIWTSKEIDYAMVKGIVHYNGQKPWKGYCVNFDIWWETYRNTPFFDKQFYFNFFNEKLDEYDRLPLLKRLKILIRFFVYGRKH